MGEVIKVIQQIPYTVTVVQRQSVLVPDHRTVSLEVPGLQGPQGIPGPPGSSGAAATVQLPIGVVITGLKIVRSVLGVIYPVDTSLPDHAEDVIGLALQSVTVVGNDVTVQTAGPVTDSSWNWSSGTIWCGPDGTLTQSPSATGWLMEVGRVVNSTTIQLDIEPPIYRG